MRLNSFSPPPCMRFFSPAVTLRAVKFIIICAFGLAARKREREIKRPRMNQSPDAPDALRRVLRSFSSATISKPDPGELLVTNEDKYLNLMMGAVEYAIFPHAARPAFSTFAGSNARDSAWNWVVRQVRSNVVNEDWAHAPNRANYHMSSRRCSLRWVGANSPFT